MKSIFLIFRVHLTLFVLMFLSGGCTYLARYTFLQGPDVYDYKKLPTRVVPCNNNNPLFTFRKAPQFDVRTLTPLSFNNIAVTNLDAFLEKSGTTAFMVIRNDSILVERYFNKHDANTLCKSFSASKVFLSALIGIAIDEGKIQSANDPVMKYIPEIKDKRFSTLTINHCLNLTAGINSNNKEAFPWHDKVKIYYTPDLRKLISKIDYLKESGKEFSIEEFSPVILALVLERATGKNISTYLSEKIWSPMAMQSNALWVIDSKKNGFEAANSGLTALPVDFARFGRLYLNNGNWNGKQLVPEAWVQSTTFADTTKTSFYKNVDFYEKHDVYFNSMWWGLRKNKLYEFSANGHFGQRIYIVPHKNLIMVRFGTKDGHVDWTCFLMKLAEKL